MNQKLGPGCYQLISKVKELFEELHIKNTIIEKLPLSFEIMTGDNFLVSAENIPKNQHFLPP